ncbi:MAG TPA: sigma-70 family RNA polymerase sigma factor [Candidatus Obscuribacterales bacterium]
MSMHAKEEFETMFRLARRMARRYGHIGTFEPDDVAHNALVKLLARTGSRPPTVGWLYKTVRSAASDAARAVARERAYVSTNIDGSPGCVCEHADQFGMVYMNGRAGTATDFDHESDVPPQLLQVLEQLAEPLKEVLVLYSSGCNYVEIARVTGAKIGTVRSRLHYARKRAKELLQIAG